ncbi:MAG TPA: superoxide dismutase family protein [Bacillota bacterium]|nr:superoxide dismutase family protein [Bacillota bacterium]
MHQQGFSTATGWVFHPNPDQYAIAEIQGGPLAPAIRGYVMFQAVPDGTWVTVSLTELPSYQPAREGEQPVGPHGFHIHQSSECQVGDPSDPFQAAGGHWNPDNQPHGNHAGDFPVLFSNDGKAMMSFFTNRFQVAEAVGHTIVIHQNPDDYRSQPAGNAGKRLACGVIKPGVKPC